MNLHGRRVFLTGATGFLGGALARELASRGVEIHALARPGSDRSRLGNLKIQWHEGDLTAARTLRIPNGTALIVHAAGPLGRSELSEDEYRRHHVDATRNLLEAALQAGVIERVLHVSSPGVLGPQQNLATEDLPYSPTNAYERAKAASEELALEFAAKRLPVIVTRPEFVYRSRRPQGSSAFSGDSAPPILHDGGRCHDCHPDIY